jgi:hypothetical protein
MLLNHSDMKKAFLIILFFSQIAIAQVGIGTTDPKGALDVSSSNLGLVLPRVTQLEDVTNNNAGLAEDGTIVYDVSRAKTCFRIANNWICIANDASIAITTPVPGPPPFQESKNGLHEKTKLKKEDQ